VPRRAGGEIVADQGDRRRRQHRLSEPNHETACKQFARNSATVRTQASPMLQTSTPTKIRLRPRSAVGEIAQRQGPAIPYTTAKAVSEQQADLRVADAEIGADGIDQQAEHLPVRVRQDRSWQMRIATTVQAYPRGG